jgi:hypothetical protein
MSTLSNNSKSILAKALATENISVQFDPSAHTAKFDIANRVLTMPILKDNESDCVTDMFIGHECAHALFSPYRQKDTKSQGGWWIEAEEIGGTGNAQYVQDIMNIIEDVRIEKLMTEKFPGLRRDFSAAYRELADRDFFSTKGMNLNDFSFIDRMNLHFKCGAFMNVQFTPEEQQIVEAVDKIRTFDEMLDASRQVFNFVRGTKFDAPKVFSDGKFGPLDSDKSNQSNDQGTMTLSGNVSPSSDTTNDNGDGKSPANPDGCVEQTNTNDGQSNNPIGGTGSAPDTLLPPINTQRSFDEKAKQIVNSAVKHNTTTVLPVPDLSKIIFPINKTHEIINSYYLSYALKSKDNEKLVNAIKTSYADLVRSMNPLINTLIKQFEMKKAADLQKRTSISRSGKIDCDRIFKYKVTDDIFSRFAKIAEGKNHGLVMYVDWSSSMQMATDDVLTQIIMLTQFCRRMNIPFDVYAFSSQVEMFRHYGLQKDNNSFPKQIKVDGSRIDQSKERGYRGDDNGKSYKVDMGGHFSLIHMLSSSMSKTQINQAMLNMYMLGKMITGHGAEFQNLICYRGVPNYFGQGNTPLDPTIVAAMYMVPEFREKHKVQIVNTIFLTDGESGYNMFNAYTGYDSYSSQFRSVVRSPINNKEYLADDATPTDTLLRMFRDITGSNTIGFYIQSSSYCRYTNEDSKSFKKQLKEQGFIEASPMLMEKVYDYATREYKNGVRKNKNHGYDRLFILPSRVEIVDDLEELDSLGSNATLTRIRNTFMKSVEKRGNSRLFLNRFADVIANPTTK